MIKRYCSPHKQGYWEPGDCHKCIQLHNEFRNTYARGNALFRQAYVSAVVASLTEKLLDGVILSAGEKLALEDAWRKV